jgi:integrase
VERVPFTRPYAQLRAEVLAMPQDTVLAKRNRLLLWTLLETGSLVSETARLRYDQIQGEKRPVIRFGASSDLPREVEVSTELARELRDFQRRKGAGEWVFTGFTRGGPLVGPITPRGVELLVRAFASPGESKDHTVTPRTFRHSRAIDWLKQGIARAEIQRRLGLKTVYAFRTLEPLLAGATSDPGSKPHPAGK